MQWDAKSNEIMNVKEGKKSNESTHFAKAKSNFCSSLMCCVYVLRTYSLWNSLLWLIFFLFLCVVVCVCVCLYCLLFCWPFFVSSSWFVDCTRAYKQLPVCMCAQGLSYCCIIFLFLKDFSQILFSTIPQNNSSWIKMKWTKWNHGMNSISVPFCLWIDRVRSLGLFRLCWVHTTSMSARAIPNDLSINLIHTFESRISVCNASSSLSPCKHF